MKLWSGRFSKEATSSVDEFNASIGFDQRLFKEDIEGSIAHARMLAAQEIITDEEAAKIVAGLKEILEEIENGEVTFKEELEDIHMNVEALLTEKIGDVGKKLHTARSRNDQVALDLRMYLRGEMDEISSLITTLIDTLKRLANENQNTVMPGYTHLQRAQPVTLAFHLLAYCEMFSRDISRLEDSQERMNLSPLGSGAMSGTTYDTDREYVAEELGFDGITRNAMDSVSDRDFALEFLFNASLTMMHLSRFCEELIIWSSTEFGFIEMDDSYSTGSSIMPQKKNPDMAELIRGKTGRVYGDLVSLLTVMKALPLAYNKDMQEDKLPVFDAIDTLKSSLSIFTGMIDTMKINSDRMEQAALSGFMNATDAADYLVKKGVPFRDCHAIIGRMVLYAIEQDKRLEALTLDELRSFSEEFDEDIYEHIDIRACIGAKLSKGSTSPKSVKEQIED